MKVLLINPAQDLAQTAGHYRRMLTIMPPISLAYLTAACERADIDVDVHDNMAAGGDRAALEAAIRRSRPDIVGMSVVTGVMPDVERVVHLVRHVAPEATVVLGGIHADLFYESILKAGLADIVAHGEGEQTIVELARALAKTQPALGDVLGISFVRDGEVVSTPPRPYVKDLDTLPFPAWHRFPLERYRIFNFARVREPGVLIQGSRGCPYRCTYCSLKIMGSKRRVRSAQSLADEFEYLYDRFGFVQPSFVDPIYPFNTKEGVDFASELIRRGLHKKQVWVTETRTDHVNPELLEALYESGLRRIMYGFETGAQAELERIHKSNRLGKSEEAVRMTKKAGIQIIGFFMLGIPGATKKSMQQTIDFAKSLDIDFAKFSVFVPYPGTAVYDEMLANGELLEPENWRRYTTVPTHDVTPNFAIPGLTPDDIVHYQRKAHAEFYLRPRMIWHHLATTRSFDAGDIVSGLRIVAEGALGQLASRWR